MVRFTRSALVATNNIYILLGADQLWGAWNPYDFVHGTASNFGIYIGDHHYNIKHDQIHQPEKYPQNLSNTTIYSSPYLSRWARPYRACSTSNATCLRAHRLSSIVPPSKMALNNHTLFHHLQCLKGSFSTAHVFEHLHPHLHPATAFRRLKPMSPISIILKEKKDQ